MKTVPESDDVTTISLSSMKEGLCCILEGDPTKDLYLKLDPVKQTSKIKEHYYDTPGSSLLFNLTREVIVFRLNNIRVTIVEPSEITWKFI